MKVLVTQSCPTRCDTMDCNLPGSSVPGILQARSPFPGDPLNPGIKAGSPTLQADSLPYEPQRSPLVGKPGIKEGFVSFINKISMLYTVCSGKL